MKRFPMTITPWRRAAQGRAWQIDIDAARKRVGVAPEDDATVGGWIIEAPWAHPMWHSYWLQLYHLRPMPDARETKLYRPDASHEFVIYALDPNQPREPAVRAGEVHYLTPLNFAAQIAETSDAAARSRMEGAIELIIAGELNPDTDAQRQWEALFGNAMIKREYRTT